MTGARSSGWLVLSLLLLAAVLAAELHYGTGGGAGQRSSSTARVPDLPVPAPDFTLAGRDTFTETLTRPLFMPDRRPAQAAAPDTPAAAPAARPGAPRYALSAVVIVDDERIAIVTDTATGELRRVREGESLAGWRVEAIHDDRAELRNGDTREALALRTFAPPAPVAPTRAPRADAPPERRRPAGRVPRLPVTVPPGATN